MQPRSLQSKIVSWLILALATAVVANFVWTLIAPIIIPGACLAVGTFVVVNLFRWWRSRGYW